MPVAVSKSEKMQKERLLVWKGKKHCTSGGLTKSDLMKNKDGKIVSVRASEAATERNLRRRDGYYHAPAPVYHYSPFIYNPPVWSSTYSNPWKSYIKNPPAVKKNSIMGQKSTSASSSGSGSPQEKQENSAEKSSSPPVQTPAAKY
ncbi:unnamed protein product [Amoebophrya sp. A25]|nr:unnamed protein product [Amoebophrya sp. A25]|eukprot:GSA25T00002410001.1